MRLHHRSVQLVRVPCGCEILLAFDETRMPDPSGKFHVETRPGETRRVWFVTWSEAEEIRLLKLNDPYWGSKTNPSPNPVNAHCTEHAYLGDTQEWCDFVLGRT